MNTKELETKIKEIRTEIEQLQETFSELYAEELKESPQEIGRGFRFNLNTDLFNEAEKKANADLESLTIDAMRIIRDLSEELSDIVKKQYDVKGYERTLIDGVEEEYNRLYIDTDKLLQSAEEVSDTLKEMAQSLQPIASKRYFKTLEPREIIKEAQAIADSFEVLVNTEDSTYQGLSDFLQKLSQFFDSIGAVNLWTYYQNDYYTLRINKILPTNYTDLTEEGLKDFIRENVEPCFTVHIEALKERKYPQKEITTAIDNTVEAVYNALNISLDDAGAVENGLSVMRRSVGNMLYPYTAITRTMREPFIYGENKPVSEGYKINNKPINSYMTITALQDLEGVEGRKLSFEETGICIAVANELISGNEYVTTQMLYKTWAGGDSTTKLNAKQKEKKNQLIETLRKEEQIIDQREYKIEKNLKEDAIQEPILDIVKAYGVHINGQYQDWCWKIRSIPPFIRHAINIGYVETIPSSQFNIGLNMKYYPLRDYLLEEIHRIRGDIKNTETETQKRARLKTEAKKKAEAEAKGKTYKSKAERKTQHPIVLFDTIFKKVYEGTKDKRSHKGIKYATEQILSYWKGLGVISDYEMLYDGIGRKKKELSDSTIDYCYGVKISVRNSETIEEG